MTGACLHALPAGADYPRALVEGLLDRMANRPPEALARVQMFVNTARMQRRIRAEFDRHGPRLLPRIRLIDDFGRSPLAGQPLPEPVLRRRLELLRLVRTLVDRQPDFAPGMPVFGLTDSLAALMDEMQDEGVTPDALGPDLAGDHARHWERSLSFIRIVAPYFAAGADPDARARQRRMVEALAADWRLHPPPGPVVVAGSTGSRGPTALLMQAVAALPEGWVVLPGFDFDMPAEDWDALDGGPVPQEDHPQYRFRRLMTALGLGPGEVRRWTDVRPPNPARARLISMALRPAPVTDRWMSEGPALGALAEATRDMTLIEAPDPRVEAAAIALCLRKAREDGRSAALVTPDRTLARRVASALDRWGIVPDDSAGVPLSLTAPGRFLRQTADLLTRPLDVPRLLALLKHPLTATGAAVRGDHLRLSRDLELRLRRKGPAFPTDVDLVAWAADGEGRADWAAWLGEALAGLPVSAEQTVPVWLDRHLRLSGSLAAGPGGDVAASELWQKAEGRALQRAFEELGREAPLAGAMTAAGYADLVGGMLSRAQLRESVAADRDVAIWGTIEARGQGADVLILAGLNEGIWPSPPAPDAWLSRQMRLRAGLLLPERQVGLSAHDFQQAACGPQVILSRALRDDQAETVPSRWLARLTNLVGGLAAQGGPAALDAMRDRGIGIVRLAVALETPDRRVPPAPRPAPRPPVASRPRQLSVTEISRLTRDPYAVYARHVLGLRPLDPLSPGPSARLRGEALHDVVRVFLLGRPPGETLPEAHARLMSVTEAVLRDSVPWPAARRFWLARMQAVSTPFLAAEADRARIGTPAVIESAGAIEVTDSFRLTARPDRIDLMQDGRAHVYDYKTGGIPGTGQRSAFDNQLLLEAVMVERGGFAAIGPRSVEGVSYIRLGGEGETLSVNFNADLFAATWDGLNDLVDSFARGAMPYKARRALHLDTDTSDYDHLSRFGEWQTTDDWTPEDVG